MASVKKTTTMSTNPSLIRRIFCALGLHAWEDVDPQHRCSEEDTSAAYGELFSWKRCKHCGLEEDNRCEICQEHGSAVCRQMWVEAERAKLVL